jgi:SAM-dependent methyltransferase
LLIDLGGSGKELMERIETGKMIRSLDRTYTFHDVGACNMCGSDVSGARILGLRLSRSQGRWPRTKRGIAVTVCRCRSCELIFADPLPIPRTLSDHYGLPPESYWKNVDYNPAPGYFGRQIETAKRLLDFRSDIKAIDVGIGLGKAARVMREAGFDVFGLEPSEPFYRKAMELLGADDRRFQLAAMEDAEFEAGGFDFVTFGAVLEHLYDPDAALAKAMRWLRSGGVAHAEIPNSRHLVGRLINAYYRLLGTGFVTNISPMHVPLDRRGLDR